ncbi:MAG: SdiA-regulated domain-containing protein [Marinirhabdus sp.]|nr:SdiA-regulated domain-containing protein [Marinirhabdus sp.]
MSIKNIKIISGAFFVIAIAVVLYLFLKDQEKQDFPKEYTVEKVWNLPRELDEVSGIAWLEDGKLLMVQDEEGALFIFDLNFNEVTQKIPFGDDGDYEGVTVVGQNAYVLRSDGMVFQIENFQSDMPHVTQYESEFSSRNNMESLTYDIKRNVLVVVPKDRDTSDDFKGLYEISIGDWTIDTIPKVKIKMGDTIFMGVEKKKIHHTFSPSDIAIHPISRSYYVLDGRRPKLLLLDPAGGLQRLIRLDRKRFPQPEGITFSPNGTLYISNESTGGVATVIRLRLKE